MVSQKKRERLFKVNKEKSWPCFVACSFMRISDVCHSKILLHKNDVGRL